MSGHFVRIDEGAINQTRVEDSSSSPCQYVSMEKGVTIYRDDHNSRFSFSRFPNKNSKLPQTNTKRTKKIG